MSVSVIVVKFLQHRSCIAVCWSYFSSVSELDYDDCWLLGGLATVEFRVTHGFHPMQQTQEK